MKIENNPINPLSTNKSDETRSVKNDARASESTSTSSVKDKAELSQRARLFSKARVAFDSTSDVDQDKVSSIKQRIENGDYNIPYESLVPKFLGLLGLKSDE